MTSAILPAIELNSQQMEMLELLCEDNTNAEIAKLQGRTFFSITCAMRRMCVHLGCRSRVGVAVWWTRSRLALYVAPTPAERAKAIGASA